MKTLLRMFGDNGLFERNRRAAAMRNIRVMKASLNCGILVFFLAFAGTFFFDDLAYMRTAYIVIISLCAALRLVLSRATPKMGIVLIYVMFCILIAYSIFTSAFTSPNFICVTVLAFIFQFAVLYLDKSVRINAAIVAAAALYLAVVCQYKNPLLLTDEIINVSLFSVVGCVLGTFTRRAQLENYDMQETLRMSEEQYRLVLAHSQSIICRYDVADRSVTMSPDVAALFMMPERVEDVPYAPVRLGNIAPDSTESYVRFYESILKGAKAGTASFRVKTADGWRWLKGSFTTVFSDAGDPAYAVISFVDVTEQREKELAYQKWRQELAAMNKGEYALFEWNLTSDAPEGESGELLEDFKDITGDTFNERTAAYAERIHPDDRAEYSARLGRELLLENYRQGEYSHEMDYRELKANGGYRWMRMTVQLVAYPDSGEIKSFLIIRDIDERKRRHLSTMARAREDALTGLLNRTAFTEETCAILGSEDDSRHAFVMLDVDNFKAVNDTLGHIEGDKFLVTVADCLRKHLRKDDIMGRLGGDEFVVCLKNISDAAGVEKRITGICEALCKKLSSEVSVSASFGIALFPQDGQSFEELYRKADIALYEAKKRGRSCYEFYKNEMESSAYTTNATPIDEVTEQLKMREEK